MSLTIKEIKRKTDIPVVEVDGQGVFLFVNERFCKVFGFSREEILGQSLTTIIPTHLHDAHTMGFSRFLSTEKPTLLGQPLKLKAVNKNGEELEAEHFIIAEKIGQQWHFAATIKPLGHSSQHIESK